MQHNVGLVGTLVLLAAGCGPAASSERTALGGTSSSSVPKTLTIGILQEPTDFYGFGGSVGFGGVSQIPPIALDTLVVQEPGGALRPQLAAELISVQQGTWRVNPDGSMDTIWKLRPNIRWHDGEPFTSADMLFTLAVRQDPATSRTVSGRIDLVQSASAPDPQTFVLHWSAPYADANLAADLEPLPMHLLEETFQNHKDTFANSTFLSDQFVGQGPYRLVDWQRGSQMAFTRFDDYYQGRPPLDRVVVRFLGDANTMVAGILSGAVDMLLPVGVDLDAAAEVQRQWTGTGNQVRYDLTESYRQIELQFRPEYARPADGLINLPVRTAFYQAIDRQKLAELFAHGLAPIADSFVAPNSALRPALESAIPQYPYDPAQASRILASGGWTRGADGTLVNAWSGDRFETELRASDLSEQKLMSAVASQWRDIGAQVNEVVIPPTRARDREYGSTYAGGQFSAASLDILLSGRAATSEIRTAANHWTGRNRSGYSNPRLDELVNRTAVTIDADERTEVLRQLVQEERGDLVGMPLYWTVSPVLQVKGVKSHGTAGRVTTWNFYEFDKE